ncbi:hypothetical protein F0U61_53520 [Archangium violaceum]|uniref:hypothetical protein n=1 Tax=Archangium violaceum TaxID=83451 RepID=UPI002B282AA3|nr:hypothetical protein F0U61_53520 [Archangium violaceum]
MAASVWAAVWLIAEIAKGHYNLQYAIQTKTLEKKSDFAECKEMCGDAGVKSLRGGMAYGYSEPLPTQCECLNTVPQASDGGVQTGSGVAVQPRP